jgi:ketosteroid isomerase-like protein
MPSRERVQQLIALVEKSKFVEAIREFYAEDATMQENLQTPRMGMDVLIAGEQKVLDTYKEVRTFPVTAFLVEGDRAVIHWIFEFITHDGRFFQQDELAFQRWRGDKIVEERFYYDPGQRKLAPIEK